MSLTEQDLERIEERIDRKLASHFEQMDERFDGWRTPSSCSACTCRARPRPRSPM